MAMKKKLAVVTTILVLAAQTAFAGGGQQAAPAAPAAGGAAPAKTYHIKVSGISGSLNYLPIYIAQREGWFKEAGVTFDEVLFSNGPVQMEALAANGWDIGATGVGGVLTGAIRYKAKVIGASNTDDGTQYVFARNNSPIVAAGKGHSSIDPNIYGDAASWKGKTVLCNTGTVLQYLLIKTLGGFGLTAEDVQFMAMDVPTAFSTFMAGTGDLAVLTGAGSSYRMLADKNFTPVSSGTWAKTGLMCNFMGNSNSLANPETRAGMKIFLKVYFKTLDWMKQNWDKVTTYMVDFAEESGNTMNAETAAVYVKADRYYTLQEACDLMNNKAPGTNMSIQENNLMGVLKFFINAGNYKQGDDALFAGNEDPSLLNEILAGK
jgi:ABC-type nitrate/sulfonate/bicarbonate transport system substrate-binding protein